jgi:probable HAF family extracellular repeat protein
LWDGTTMLDLGTLGGSQSEAVAMNDSGQVTGISLTAGDEEHTFTHAFLWNGTTMLDLGTLGGTDSFAEAINATGQVTGWSWIEGNFDPHAFLWDDGTLHDLNALIDPADPLLPFVYLREGVDINDFGQILVTGFDSRTFRHSVYLASPVPSSVPEPGTLTLLGLGLLALGLVRRRAA